MKANEWGKIKDVFAQVLEQPETGRAEFLKAACAGDGAMRAEIESLLKAYDETKPLIERSDFGASSLLFTDEAADEDFYAGKQFGHYRIEREIGRGGMGAVFLAERIDGEFNQQVALKIVRRSFADRELGKRFRQERQILASLNHPNIAKLLDGGVSADGEPFLAMEYVEGERIDDYCEGKNLSTRERLKLFLAVCKAVAFAHQNLIVHRDLKPSNILVGKDGNVKLLDFGIAKLIDRENADEQTRTAFRAFTPEYAAPEQIAGSRITTAADVFSLGVLLEDLLQGAHYSASAPDAAGKRQSGKIENGANGKTVSPDGAMNKTIATNLPTNQENKNPESKIQSPKSLSGELKNIIAMARREEPSRRYASVGQFAEDVERYLDGLPVRAQRDSFTYRAEKFVARNKISVGAGALVLIALVAGFTTALWQGMVAREQKNRAEKRFADVRRLSNALLLDIAPKIERLEGSTSARRSLVNESLRYLDSLASESGEDDALQSELAAAYEKIGELQGAPRRANLSDFTGAIASFEKAQQIRRKLLEKNANDFENQKSLAKNVAATSYIRWWTGDIGGSLPEAQNALETYEKLLASSESKTDLRLAAAEAQINLAQIYFDNDRLNLVHPPLEKAIAALSEESAQNVEAQTLLARSRALLGSTFSWETKQTEAEREMAAARGIIETLADERPRDASVKRELYDFYFQNAGIYEDIDNARALEFLQKARGVADESVRADAADIQARQTLAKVLSKLGEAFINLKRDDESIPYLEQSQKTLADLQANEPENQNYGRDTGRNLMILGQANLDRRDYARALENLARAREIFESQAAANSQNIFARRKLASIYSLVADTESAFAAASDAAARFAHLRAARENYERELNAFQQLEASGALTEFDRKYIAQAQTALQKLGKEK